VRGRTSHRAGTAVRSTTLPTRRFPLQLAALALSGLVGTRVQAQTLRVPRVGYLRPNEVARFDDAFRGGLRGSPSIPSRRDSSRVWPGQAAI